MEQSFNAMALIQAISNTLRDEKLKNIDSIDTEIQALGRYLGTDKMQTVIFSAIFDRYAGNSESDIDDITGYFECSALEIVGCKKGIEDMVCRGLLEVTNHSIKFLNMRFRISNSVFDAIVNMLSIEECIHSSSLTDQFEFVKIVGKWAEDRRREHVSTADLVTSVKGLEQRYCECEFICKVQELIPDIFDRIIFYCICKDSYHDNSNSCLNNTFMDIMDDQKELLRKMKLFIDESSVLHSQGLVISWKYSDNDYALKLSRHGFELLLGEFADCKIGRTAGLTNVEFVEAVNNLIQERRDRDFNLGRMRYEVMELEQRNQGLNLVRRISSIVDNPIDRILFYYICHNLFEGSTYLDSSLKAVFGDQKKIMEESVLWQNEEHPLQVYGLVELGEESFFGGNKIELTEDGMEIFLEENAEKFKKKDKTNDILSVDKIKAKNLYYSDKLDSQISFLRDSLQEDAFSKLQERLEEQALPVGVAAIFYGSPGTGKTETVYQLAKATGRDVMQVDISEMKTCWYGESQKLVKGVFTKYERLCRKNKKLPILLFNEADAIFSKRLEAKGSSVDQTENAIQNIILEQMEKLKGILIATTNLESSLDPAFERRFLFKLQFERPSVEAKKHIWMDKLGDLSETDAAILAGNYNLSGGEINNVTRKVTMNKVLTGEAYTLDYLKELCEQEKFTNQRAVIGF